METFYVNPNLLQPNYKGPRCFGIRGYQSAPQESLRSTAHGDLHVAFSALVGQGEKL